MQLASEESNGALGVLAHVRHRAANINHDDAERRTSSHYYARGGLKAPVGVVRNFDTNHENDHH